MAIFQPSNVIPSSFAGVGLGTVDVNDRINISWQVNGNSPMTAYRIQIYDNSSTSGTAISDSNIQVLAQPFYGVDPKGNPQQFIVPTTALWSELGLANGNEYKMVITQWWGDNPNISSSTQITQYSGSVFLTRETPSVSIQYQGNNLISGATISNAIAEFTATYLQAQGDSINSVRWQVFDDEGNVVDDTGFINTSALEYTYSGFFTGSQYSIQCSVETQNGVVATTNAISFNVVYEEAETSQKNIQVKCLADDSVLISWGKAISIPGELSPTGTPSISGGELMLSNGQSVSWDSVDGENMNFEAPYTIAQKGSLPITKSGYQANQTKTVSDTQTLTATLSQKSFNATGNLSVVGDYIGNKSFGGTSGFRDIVSVNNNWLAIEDINKTVYFYTNDFLPNGSYYLQGVTPLSVCGNENYYAILCFNSDGYYVEVSTNLISWNRYSLPSGILYNKLIVGNNLFVALGSNGFAYCNSGSFGSWSTKTNTTIEYCSDIAYGNNLFVIVGGTMDGRQGKIATFNSQTKAYNVVYNDSQSSYIKVGYGNGYFIAIGTVGSNGNLWVARSANATAWTSTASFQGTGVLSSLIYGAGYFVITSGNTVYRSSNGLQWSEISLSNQSSSGVTSYTSIAYNNNLFAIVSRNDTSRKMVFLGERYVYLYEYTANNEWLYSITNNSLLTNINTSPLNSPNGLIIFTLNTNSYLIRNGARTLSTTVYFSTYPYQITKTLSTDFELGVFDSATLESVTPSNANISFTKITDNSYTTTIIVNTQKFNLTYTVDYNYVISYYGTAYYTVYPTTKLFESTQYLISISSVATAGTNIAPYKYYVNIYDNISGQYLIPQNTLLLQDYVNSTTINFFFSLTSTQFVFQLSNYFISINNIVTTQVNISRVTVYGSQYVDWITILKGQQNITSNYQPSWNNNVYLLTDFVTNTLQAGTSSSSANASAVYRFSDGDIALKPIIKSQIVGKLKDYGVRSNQPYSYEIFYLDNNGSYSKPLLSASVCKQFEAYSLIEAKLDLEDVNVYHVLKVWRFGNNISAGAMSNNNSPNWFTNFTPYRLKQPSSRQAKSGTLQALLSNYNQSENFYQDTVKMMEELYQASVSTNTFFLKDTKGNLYMVGISAPISQTINIKSKLQEVKVSIPWEEVGDASNISLIQLPTDEGWQDDEVFDVVLSVNTDTGVLSATYPRNYRGTTFSLYAYTPDDINGANLILENGAVIASKDTEN